MNWHATSMPDGNNYTSSQLFNANEIMLLLLLDAKSHSQRSNHLHFIHISEAIFSLISLLYLFDAISFVSSGKNECIPFKPKNIQIHLLNQMNVRAVFFSFISNFVIIYCMRLCKRSRLLFRLSSLNVECQRILCVTRHILHVCESFS